MKVCYCLLIVTLLPTRNSVESKVPWPKENTGLDHSSCLRMCFAVCLFLILFAFKYFCAV